MKSIRTFGLGEYHWKISIPKGFGTTSGGNDKVSIGAFLYAVDPDDSRNFYELDFEIGRGKRSLRDAMKVENNDLIVFMTSQNNPYSQRFSTIKEGETHFFSIGLSSATDDNYLAEWKINNNTVTTLPLEYNNDVTLPSIFIT